MASISKFFKSISQNSKLDRIIDVLILLDMILIGSDRISIVVAGMTIRFVQLLIVLTFGLMYVRKKISLINLLTFIPFLISTIISTIFSYAIFTSVTYIFWTIFNYLLVYCLFYSWAKEKEKQYVIDLWLLSFAIQSIYVITQYIMGIFKINDLFFPMTVYMEIYRPAIWFYEPSYLATYFVVYLTISTYLFINKGDNKYKMHMWVSFLCLLVTSSTTGYLGIVVSSVACVLLTISSMNLVKMKRIGIVMISFIIITIGIYSLTPNRFEVFVGRILPEKQQSLATEEDKANEKNKGTEEIINDIARTKIGAASGGRVEGWLEAYEVFKEHPIIGIGPNAYEEYVGGGVPASNVTLEILANLGIVGMITFSVFVLSIIYNACKLTKKEDIIQRSAIMALFVFVIILQANQNYQRLYMWMQFGFISGLCHVRKKI